MLAAFRRERNTRHLAPIVRPSVEALERLLTEIGRRDLLKRNGHYEVWLGHCSGLALAQADSMRRLGIRTEPAPRELLRRTLRSLGPECRGVVVSRLRPRR